MFGAGNGSIWKGILIGVGVSAVGFYAYKKNEDKVDAFLRRRGMDLRRTLSLFVAMGISSQSKS